MFKIRFETKEIRPDQRVTIRSNGDNWAADVGGDYLNDAWVFQLDEDDYPGQLELKFRLDRRWMTGPNILRPTPAAGAELVFGEGHEPPILFPPLTEVLVENGSFAERFFKPALDENHLYDVIVIGSGVGGGIVADDLADKGADVLMLEAGSHLFSTHTANLPRQLELGQFQKHLWALWDEYKITNYTNTGASQYAGAQAFNLGGRSVFWGGFIPRMSWWELETWPQAVRWDLENFAYEQAEELMYWPAPPSAYQGQVKTMLANTLPGFVHLDAPMAVRQMNPSQGTLPVGMFSTADLLTEQRLTPAPQPGGKLAINLHHAVTAIVPGGVANTRVVAHDLLSHKDRSYRGKYVVLAAGTVESAKVFQMSNLQDASGLAGKGLTDHPIFFTHFSIPPGKPFHRLDSSAKILSRFQQANAANRPFNILIELGADLNQGRYIDKDTLAAHQQLSGGAMLCEIVFLFNAPLVDTNTVVQAGPSYAKPVVNMVPSAAAAPYLADANALKDTVIAALEGQALPGQDLSLKAGGLGGVAHEVGTLRMGMPGEAVVDPTLKVNGHDNIYVCDLSVFPTSPAANPTLTLAALAIRLANELKQRGGW